MDKKTELLKLIPEQGILPLYYHHDAGISIETLRALYNAGIRIIEYADRGEQAFLNFIEMRKVRDKEFKDLFFGIGTVKNSSDAKRYIDAGADFIICPGMIESVAILTNRLNILWIPGCMTPTEMISAEALGAKIIKLFPSNDLGPSYLDAISPVFSELLFMPTGGIELNEGIIRGWLKSGACALGGSKLITKSIMDNRQFDLLTKNTIGALQLYRSVRESLPGVKAK